MTPEEIDQVKEISAKIVHEKMKDAQRIIEGNVVTTMINLMKRGSFSNGELGIKEFDEIVLKRLERDCMIKVQAIFRASYLKFMECFKVEDN